jgi:serine/threonine-protein kinase HipA
MPAAATVAEVILWDRPIGALAWDPARRVGTFEYAADFLGSGIELAPLLMPLRAGAYAFPGLPERSFKGLPGLLADSLPDRFGNLLIDQWLAAQGRAPGEANPVERLCYLGARGMGALEFRPALRAGRDVAAPVEIASLVRLANEALARRVALVTRPELADRATPDGADAARAAALRDILRVGTSAGGARAKAVVAWNPATGEFRSGQVDAPPGFEHWLLKFDGVAENRDKEAIADPQGYGRLEYAYHLMARAAGIEMSDCRLFEENGRAHFMTRRFDRPDRTGAPKKLHLQSLCALAHYDFNAAGAHAYEQAFAVARALALPPATLEELFRRAVFNVLARNQDDHTKNIAFLMDQAGHWHLAPAYDVAYAYNPEGQWTARHQMTLAGKTDAFTPDDLLACARAAGLKIRRARDVIARVAAALRRWPEFAAPAGLPEDWTRRVAATHRLALAPG